MTDSSYQDPPDDEVGIAFIATVLVSIIVLVLLVIILVRQIDHRLQVSSCREFSVQSGYETKFAEYNFARYECLVGVPSGKWVPIGNIRAVNP